MRLLRLLTLLQVRREWSGAELAERLAVTTRTVRTDVERLRVLGYRIESHPGVGGGYQLGAGSALPPLLLDDDEAVAVAVGLRAAAGGSVTGIEETSLRALAKLEQSLPSRLRHRVDALRTATVSAAGGGPTVDADTLTAVSTAVHHRERLRFDYAGPRRHGQRARSSSRTVWSTPGGGGTCWAGTPTGPTGGRSAPTGSDPGCRPAHASRPGSRQVATRSRTCCAASAPRPGHTRPGTPARVGRAMAQRIPTTAGLWRRSTGGPACCTPAASRWAISPPSSAPWLSTSTCSTLRSCAPSSATSPPGSVGPPGPAPGRIAVHPGADAAVEL